MQRPEGQRSECQRPGLPILLILLTAALLRIVGLGWGLPDEEHPAAEAFHPDEFVAYEQGARVYSGMDPIGFCWGGALYLRTAHLARAVVGSDDPDDGLAMRRTLLLLRALNVLYALATILLIAWIGSALFDRRAGLVAASLFALFPGHVLDGHYARPDVLTTLFVTASLAAAVRSAAGGSDAVGRHRLTALASVLAGLAAATMLWGVAAFAGVAAAGIIRARRDGFRHLLVGGLLAAVCGIGGYLLGSVETLIYLDTYRFRLQQSGDAHRAAWRFPLLYLVPMTFFSCGLPAVVLAWSGAVRAAIRRIGPALVPAAVAVAGYALLGSQIHPMMRYVVWITPIVAVFAGAALAGWMAGSDSRRGVAILVVALVLAYTAQLSASYVLPMGRKVDQRRAVALRLAEVDPAAMVGVTASFRGDRTYQPQFPAGTGLKVFELRLFEEFDSEAVIERAPPYVITTDFALQHAWLDSARAFEQRLRAGPEYSEIFACGPPWRPLCLATLLGFQRPDDLLYVRVEFEVFRR